ncbi:methanogenesis marker 16 metalloprotein [Methanospirillum lacunae]|uniref:Methanogenesis marker 16 metalloprotein n=1 Tax=Methanospirillum lacunae TaxID=668570 RepID=A0A2V2NDE0_9EURY|nr:methanogenesis marker 16 metalloprotein [Methanospirillum lacunae]PWR74377.1 methanogenesis marker 16 metalloprotein [Methanospirillum lacunae]
MTRLQEIRERIRNKSAVVVTASEFKKQISESGQDKIIKDVDVVTCGTCGVMSGTYAVLSVPVASPGSFLRADKVALNGVPAIPGPCPNERLGLVDLIVYGTAHASSSYGGGHLFRDIISNHEIHVDVTAEKKDFQADVHGHDLPHARLFTTRSTFKNYTAIINRSDKPEKTIFSTLPLAGKSREATVSGCGEINPIENDPSLRFLTPGTQLLVNGGMGFVIGQGTRTSVARPNIAVHGEMTSMDPDYCGGFLTSAGPECLTSIGTAIPLIDENVTAGLMIRDADIPMPVMDISNRQQVSCSSYDRVWTGTAGEIRYHPNNCLNCDPCLAEKICPVHAITGSGEIDHTRCFTCGTCVHLCKGKAYTGNLGTLDLPEGDVPIVLRQSDRQRGEKISQKAKEMILKGEFQI